MLRLHLTPADLADVRVGSSALVEASSAMRLLGDPAPGAVHADWARRTRRALRHGGLRLAWALHEHGRYVPDFLPPPPLHPPDIRLDLVALRRTPAAAVRYHMAFAYPDGAPADVGVFDHAPAPALERLAAELAALWRIALAPLWPQARVLVEEELLRRAGHLVLDDPRAVFGGLHPGLRLRGDVLEVDGPPDADVQLRGQGLFLVPTAFAGPQVRVVANGELRTGIAYEPPGVAALFAEPRAERADGALEAVVGAGRGRLLRALREPDATTDLAGRLGVSPGAVSQQLRILSDAGLVVATRRGRRVEYALSEQGRALLAVFERGAASRTTV